MPLSHSHRNRVNYTVRVGSPWINQTTETSSDVPVKQVIINSGYQSRRYWSWVGRIHDIGLLKLKWELKYSKYVWPVCLPGLEYVVEDGSLCTVTGWGYPKANGESEPHPPIVRVHGGESQLGCGWGAPWMNLSGSSFIPD